MSVSAKIKIQNDQIETLEEVSKTESYGENKSCISRIKKDILKFELKENNSVLTLTGENFGSKTFDRRK